MDQQTRQQDSPERSEMPTLPETESPSLVDVMAAIQGVKGALEGKMDSMAAEVTLLRAEFRKLGERVKENQASILTLQAENNVLKH